MISLEQRLKNAEKQIIFLERANESYRAENEFLLAAFEEIAGIIGKTKAQIESDGVPPGDEL